MSDTTEEKRFRYRVFIGPVLLLLYLFSHVYHLALLRVRATSGTLLRDIMETIQGPMVLSRLFLPYIGVVVAIWILRTDKHKRIGVIVLATMVVCCFVSYPFLKRFVLFMVR